MRSAVNNPFAPGWSKPPVWAGRRNIVEEFTEVILPRVRAGVKEAPRLIQDERGMGKTALLEVLADEARDRDLGVVRLAGVSGERTVRVLARQLAAVLVAFDAASALTAAVRGGVSRMAGLTAGPFSMELHPGPTNDGAIDSVELADALVAAATAAGAKGGSQPRGGGALVVLIDEVQNIDVGQLAVIFSALQRAMQHTVEVGAHPTGGSVWVHVPIILWVAGLPGSLSRFKQAGTTFGECCELVDFGPLSEEDIREVCLTFTERNSIGVAFDGPAIDAFVDAVGGYPHAFQLIGKEAWNAGTGPLITAEDVAVGVDRVEPHMRERYAARLAGLSDDQRRYLIAVAGLPAAERTPTKACRAFRNDPAAKASQCGSLSQRLVEYHQVLRSDNHGLLSFTLRGMDAYLRALDSG